MLASFTHVPGGAARTTALVLLLAGFAIKAGLVPFQVWLPRGYAAAPAPARAVMAGVCVNVGFYGMWRTLALLGHPPGWLAGILLLLGGLSALLGIAHAAVQNRLSRVIAYSSVENSGLIITGFGVALTGAAVGNQRLVAIGLLAATLQMVTHTAAKSLLFSSAAGLEAVAGSDDLEVLRGMARRAPWSGTGLAVGSLTLAGLPPDGGVRVGVVPARVAHAAVPGGLARRAADARAGRRGRGADRRVRRGHLRPARRHGGARPGRPRRVTARRVRLGRAGRGGAARGQPSGDRRAHPAGDPGDRGGPVARRTGRADHGSAEVPVGAPAGVRRASRSCRRPGCGSRSRSCSPSSSCSAFALSGRRLLRVRRVPAWRSATIGVDGADSYTPFGYANPTRRVLASVLHTRAEVEEITPRRGGGADGYDGDRVPHLRYNSDVVEVVESWLYQPAARSFAAVVAVAKRLQSGRLDAYLLYMLIALVAVVATVTALA